MSYCYAIENWQSKVLLAFDRCEISGGPLQGAPEFCGVSGRRLVAVLWSVVVIVQIEWWVVGKYLGVSKMH